MNVLVTAGGTIVPMDRVRYLGNGATGRTGAAIAEEAWRRGHTVTLLTSRPDDGQLPLDERKQWRVVPFVTFQDLQTALEHELRTTPPDLLIHSAAVSDYAVEGVFVPVSAGVGSGEGEQVILPDDTPLRLTSAAEEKLKSDAPEVWIQLRPLPKLIDLMRQPWGFAGVLVKFKLEAGVEEAALLRVAEASRLHSRADLVVANRVGDAAEWAWIGPTPDGYQRVARADLPARLLDRAEALVTARGV